MGSLRVLVGCRRCGRQFDASGLQAGERLHCSCGESLRVPSAPAPGHREAPVVRCAACGAAREGGAVRCGFCGADFTTAERDRDTLCPSCVGRIGRHSRFCPYCGVEIHPEPVVAEGTSMGCPVCGAERPLQARTLGEGGQVVLECPRCGGLWLSEPVLRLLERAAQAEEPPPTIGPGRPGQQAPRPGEQRGPFYRGCPVCGEVMHRRNYGRSSGVIVDVCSEHGVWFDEGELEAALAWVRGGGLRQAEERARRWEQEEARRAAMRRRVAEELARGGLSSRQGVDGELRMVSELLVDLADFFGGLFRR